MELGTLTQEQTHDLTLPLSGDHPGNYGIGGREGRERGREGRGGREGKGGRVILWPHCRYHSFATDYHWNSCS